MIKNMTYKKIYIPLVLAFFVILVIIFVAYIYIQLTLPDIKSDGLIERNVLVFNKNLNSLENHKTSDNPDRKFVEINKIPSSLKNATIATEDKDFYKTNKNCNVFLQILFCKKGYCKFKPSMITQQIVKNVFLESGNNELEKMIFLPCKIDKELSKDEILQMYLNETQYSGNSYGVQAASKEFFNKNVGELSLTESAMLVALSQTPLQYLPIGEKSNELIERQKHILNLMFDSGYITKEELELALSSKTPF